MEKRTTISTSAAFIKRQQLLQLNWRYATRGWISGLKYIRNDRRIRQAYNNIISSLNNQL